MTTNRNSIYKVNHLIDKDNIKKIYVFFGNNLDVKNPDDLFKSDPKNAAFTDKNSGLPIFTDEELAKILDKSKPIDVHFSKQQIHFDDSIGTIKLKILTEFSNTFSLEQIYLFCLKEESFNSTNIFQTLTQNNRLDLTRVRLNQFLLNIYKEDNGAPFNFSIPSKEIYDYDDILELNLNNKKFVVTKVLGQKFFIVTNEYPFVCNPFQVTEYDTFIERAARKSLTTLNNHLLLNTGDIIDNNIYICLANDVLLRAKDNGVSEANTINIYYPLLAKQNIHSYDELEDNKYALIEKNKLLLKPSTLDTFESINMFYDVYKYKTETPKFKYKGDGIKLIKITIKPEFTIKIPLDVIFKVIHATDANPLIKFNPATKQTRQETIYRLYAEQTSTDGRKIPHLSRSNIFKLMRDIGKTKSVSVYVDGIDGLSLLTCEFEDNGNINITCECEKITPLAGVELIIKNHINPIIQEVKNFLEQSGYTINLYNNMYDKNVDVKQLNYQTSIEITKPIKMNDFIGCITSAFIVESKNLKSKNGINMRFKRVANFNKVTSQEAFIIEQANQKDGLKGNEIVLALIENYRMSESDARQLVQKMASEVQVERGVKKTDIEIKLNPGFKTTMKLNSITSILTIDVENINDIYYLNTIPIYLDSFIRLTQDKKSTLVPLKTINSLCSGEENVEFQVEDIIAPAELAFPEQEIPIIEGDDMDFENYEDYTEGIENYKEPKFKSALDLIYGDEDEEEEEEGENNSAKGGQPTPSSSLSNEAIATAKLPTSTSSEENNSDQKTLSSFGESLPSSAPESSPKPSLESIPKSEPIPEPKPSSSPESSSEPAPAPAPAPPPVLKAAAPIKKIPEEEEQVKDIVGMRLKNPSPFASKMFDLEPILFLKEDKGKFNRYSRSCSSSAKKQPILITEDEMKEMKDEEYEKVVKKYGKEVFEAFPKEKQDQIIKDESFLKPEDVIKYGSNPDNKYYYVCPRYWCLKTNRPIDPSEMIEVKDKDGKMVKRHPTCGGIIPNSQTEIKNDGNYVYEFFDKTEHRSQENYKQHYPGFLDADKHPDGLCIPCCFAKWNTPGQIGRRKECAQAEKEKEEKEKNKEEEKAETVTVETASEQPQMGEKVVEKDNYVKGPEKWPLENGRWGYMQVSIQNFFQEASASCQISKTNTNVKPNHVCLLRHGIEFSENQSFIACIADAKYYGESISIPTIKDMKRGIINAMNIDDYITYQNGNNVTSFMVDNVGNIDVSKYADSKLYKKIYVPQKQVIPSEDVYFKKLVASYENFIAYLNDDKGIIDYTYIWDIISRPNPRLFPQGINLIIMEIVNNDITNNIELICPTNHYSNEFYNPARQSLFIIKTGNLYEPIYAYENKVKTVKVVKTFSEHSLTLQANIRSIFTKIIKPILRDTCMPLPSMPAVYKFAHPILLSKLIAILNNKKYEIDKQIINYQSKVIGLFVKKDGLSGYIPCYPSSVDSTYPNIVFMNDESLYSDYDQTILFLNMVYKDSKGVVPVKPAFKIIEDEHVVGILTDSNQFIQLSEPMPISDAKDSIPIINDNNYVVNKNDTPMISSEYAIATSESDDTERAAYIKKIKLETNFYNVFRNTIRILLNDYENIKMREKIELELNKPYMLFSAKLHNIVSYLKELVKDTIAFSNDYDYNLINAVSTCIVLPEDKCSEKRPVCAFTSGSHCKLVIPKNNLLTNKNDNEVIYFGKMADELIRYSRIKSFIFQPQTYLSFGSIGYNLRENEIIVIQSLLTKDYFEGLVPETKNKYVKYYTYDTTEPKLTQVYDNTLVINDNTQLDLNKEREGCYPIETNISSKFWKDGFPSNYKEFYYEDANCGFYFLIDIILEMNRPVLKLNEIKAILLEEYEKYLGKYREQIIDILILEGKKIQGLRVKQKTLSFQQFIYSDDYFITNLDIWVIMNRYKIPSIIISTKPIILTNKTDNVLALYGKQDSKFAFIFSPALRVENIPKYSLIISTPDLNIFHSLDIIKNEETMRKLTESVENIMTLETFLQTFSKQPLAKKVAKKPIKFTIQGEPEESVAVEATAGPVSEPAPVQTRKQKTFVVVKKPKTRKIKFKIEDKIEDK